MNKAKTFQEELNEMPNSAIYTYLINSATNGRNKAQLAAIYAAENANGDTIHCELDELEYCGAVFDYEQALMILRGY